MKTNQPSEKSRLLKLPDEHNGQSDILQNILEQLLMPVKLAKLYAYCFLNMSSVRQVSKNNCEKRKAEAPVRLPQWKLQLPKDKTVRKNIFKKNQSLFSYCSL